MATFDIDYAADREPLERLLLSVDRSGDFCIHGRVFVLMPRLEVEGVGMLSFPVPDSQVRALVAAAERAPYGKGTATLVDTSVRDCWQIGAARIRLGGAAWPDTFSGILNTVAAGLGCPSGRLEAQLYKLLIYEPGGFFSAHRDTEKADGMIATLSVSLPVSGTGGELVVRHRGREVSIDMSAGEPSELAFAAFFADCEHETRPVRKGCRLSLVFNLCLRPGDSETPRHAPDYSDRVRDIAEQLAAWCDGEGGPDKLVWLLEHDYSEAGLSFDALKNSDAALARILKLAVDRADCVLYAAIMHIEEEGALDDSSSDYFGAWDGDNAEHLEMGEVFDGYYWLDGWVGQDGGQPALGKISLNPEELLPTGMLDEVEPDQQWVNEATGNAGITLERAYRHAAFVIWPRRRTLDILAGAGINGAVVWVAEQFGRDEALVGGLIARLIEIWSALPQQRDEQSRAEMLRLLGKVGDAVLALRFLHEIVLTRYDGSENESLPITLAMVGPGASGEFLAEMAGSRFSLFPDAILKLLLLVGELPGFEWRDALVDSVRAAVAALPELLGQRREIREVAWRSDPPYQRFGCEAIRDLFTLTWRCGLEELARDAVAMIADYPEAVTPERTVPAALDAISRVKGLTGSAAYPALWRHAVDALLARSSKPPKEPQDWTVSADVSCNCKHCRELKVFCRDPVAQIQRFPLRKELRAHLHHQIDAHQLDMSHVTERRGRPFTLVCTKNRASFQRRLVEYAEDLSWMRSLMGLTPTGEGAEAVVAPLQRLRAVTAAAV